MIRPALVGATLALLASAAGAQTYHDSGGQPSTGTGTIVPGEVPVAGDGSGPLFTSGNPGHVSGSFSAISGTVTANGVYSSGLTLSTGQAAALQLDSSGNLKTALTAAQVTALTPPSTVTANQGSANATPWNNNVAQIGGATVATGGGASNSGTQRVIIATDSPNSAFSAVSIGSLQRYTGTTAYTANTGWNNSNSATYFTFSNACRANGGAVLIPEIDIYSSANPTTKLSGVLWLFSASIGTVIADAATFTIASSDFANVTGPMQGIGFSLGNTQASGASNSATALTGTTWHAQCASGSTSISGMVEVTNAYTPAANETLTIKLHTVGVN